MLRVMIADDHPVMRRGIRHVLMETVDKVEADEVSNGCSARVYCQGAL